ncbi:Telomere-binding protein subunit beta [Gossypium arboreum]|uniref:Telomere-binding protein subunit beta n=1 Tax=Gossypium arboreum TaxID=29729 RepID=A0A0B0MRL8_GOSAR|nr:Telomere-binding protein subunit beta [Gossypium arboreum]
MVVLPANSREENSPQEQQQRSNVNHTLRPNLNVLLPQPRLPINRPDEIILVPDHFRDPYLYSDDSDSDSEYESDDYFGDEDSEDNEQEQVKPLTDNNLWSMMGDLEDDLEEHIDVLL